MDNSGTALGIRVPGGVILAVEKLAQAKMLVAGSNRRIQSADPHVGVAIAGLLPDGKHIVKRAVEECVSYRDNYSIPIPGRALANKIGMYMQVYTMYSSVRPFGCGLFIASHDVDGGPQLHFIDPSGTFYGQHACAAGKGKQIAKTALEKLSFDSMTPREAVFAAAKILHEAHEETKERDMEVEITWICEESGWKHVHVPDDILNEANTAAQANDIDEMDDDDDDMDEL
ncbi:putative proteasome subunit alpha type 3 [Ramicandelaber brevisporus]|nr:putative proteasome subunit alpha type 3 [Ramicandelaber brevisporus]